MANIQSGKRSRRNREPEILAAARTLLETRGLVGSSIADVAALAGTSEATVFNYFATRRDLMSRVITDWMLPVIERLESDLRPIHGTRARLVVFTVRHLRELAAAPGMHKLIYRELHWEDYYGSHLHRLNQRYTGVVQWIIDEGKASGDVRGDVDSDIARDMLFGTLHHISWRTYLNDRTVEIERTADQIVDQFFGGLSAAVAAAPSLEAAIDRLQAIADRLDRKG